MSSPFTPKRFSPSYPTEVKKEYVEIVDECKPWQMIDSWQKRIEAGAPPHCKRRKHIMLRGGRKASRYPDAEWAGGEDPSEFPPDPKESPNVRGGGPYSLSPGRPPNGERPQTGPGTTAGEPEGRHTRYRLKKPSPFFSARTQPYTIRSETTAVLRLNEWVPVVGTGFTTRLKTFEKASNNGVLDIVYSTPEQIDEAKKAGKSQLEARLAGTFYEVPFHLRRAVPILSNEISVWPGEKNLTLRILSPLKEDLVQQVAKAIQTYMGTNDEFLVPYEIRPLLNAGMPKAVAIELVKRAHGSKFRYTAPLPAMDLKKSLTAQLSDCVGGLCTFVGTPEGHFEFADVGELVKIEITGIPFSDFKKAQLLGIVRLLQAWGKIKVKDHDAFERRLKTLRWQKTEDEVPDTTFEQLLTSLSTMKSVQEVDATLDDIVWLEGDKLQLHTLFAGTLIPVIRGRIKDLWVNFIGKEGKALGIVERAKLFRERFLDEAVDQTIDLLFNAQLLPPDAQLFISVQAPKTKRSSLFICPLSRGEHSKIEKVAAPLGKIKYGNLSNVPLQHLPQVLVRLSRRKVKKGRALNALVKVKPNPITARRNEARSNEVVSSPLANLTLSQFQTVSQEPTLSERQQYVFNKLYPTSGFPELVLVPGTVDRVYWPIVKLRRTKDEKGQPIRKKEVIGLKEVDVQQARSWLKVNELTKIQRKEGIECEVDSHDARLANLSSSTTPTSTPPSSAPPATNPHPPANAEKGKAMTDEEAWLFQYSQEPFGAEPEIPNVHRNPRPSKSLLRKVMLRSKELQAKGHDRGAAMKKAWAEARGDAKRGKVSAAKRPAAKRPAAKRPALKAAHKRPAKGHRASKNPWYDSLYLPDTTMVRPVLVPSASEWSDPTEVRSALVPGPYGALDNPRRKRKGRRSHRNPEETSDMLEFSPEIDMWAHHPVYEQTVGQFSTGEAFTHGIQPVNRRNPRRSGRSRHNAADVMTARFPSHCSVCDGVIERGEEIVYSGDHGPRGGKLVCHVDCHR